MSSGCGVSADRSSGGGGCELAVESKMAQLAAFNTMTAIKKKLHGMKQKREEAFDRADQLEQKFIEHRAISEKVPRDPRAGHPARDARLSL